MTPPRKDLGPLPSYQNPPVNEVAIGLVFSPIKQFRAPHFGLFWERIRGEYPSVDHAPLITNLLEFGTDNLPLPRVWFIHKSDEYVIQLQNDRLMFNWRQQQAGSAYPRFHAVLNGFLGALELFQKFLPEVTPDQLSPQEVTVEYINTIFRGEGWEKRADLGAILKDVVWCETERFLPSPTDLAWRTVFDIEGDNGQLIVSSRFGKRTTDDKELLRIELKAFRKCKDREDLADTVKWYDIAHEWIVRGFSDVTTPKAQSALWNRQQ